MWCFFLQKKYRQLPDRLKFTSVTDSPDIIHAKTSYQQCSEVCSWIDSVLLIAKVVLPGTNVHVFHVAHYRGCTNLGKMTTCINTPYTQTTRTLSEPNSTPSRLVMWAAGSVYVENKNLDFCWKHANVSSWCFCFFLWRKCIKRPGSRWRRQATTWGWTPFLSKRPRPPEKLPVM